MITIDKKGVTERQVLESFADDDGLRMFEIAVKEYVAGNEAKGVWATVQAGYDLVNAFYSTHNGEYPVGNIDFKAFGERADYLAAE